MDRKIIEDFEKEKNIVLPEVYIKFLIDNEKGQENLDISLFGFEEFVKWHEWYTKDNFAPNHIAIGCGGGSELLVMKQEEASNELIVTSAGNYIEQYLTKEYCSILQDFDGWVKRGFLAIEINPTLYDEDC